MEKVQEESMHPERAPVAKHPDPQLLKALHDIQDQDGNPVELTCSDNINDVRLTKYMKQEIVMKVKD